MLRATVLETLPEAEAAGFDFRPLDELVAWKRTPSFTKMGRTGAERLAEPFPLPTPRGELLLRGLKVKGIGLSDHEGEVCPPTVREHNRIHPHLGFTPEGDFVSIRSRPAPLGGITLPMARAEYEIGRRLLARGCPAQVPLRLYRYEEPGMVFAPAGEEPRPLAVVVSAVTVGRFVRANEIFNYPVLEAETRGRLDLWARRLGVEAEPHRELALAREVAGGFVRALRGFHEAGQYRYSGQPDNYAYCRHTEEVFLIDLDSSRPLAECSAVEAPLQLLRDVASALYGVTAYMLRRQHVERFRPAEVRRAGLYPGILAGYYHDAPAALVETAGERLAEHYERIHHEARRRHAARELPVYESGAGHAAGESYDRFRRARRQQYWIHREATLSFFVAALWDLLPVTALGRRHPRGLSRWRMLAAIAAYTDPATADTIETALAPEHEAAAVLVP